MDKSTGAAAKAVLAAALFGISAPVSKILLQEIPETLLAGLLYLGAGAGMAAVRFFGKAGHKGDKEEKEAPLTKKDIPYTVAMVLLDVAAPVCMLVGLASSSAAGVSLLNNFEIVATCLLARFLFREPVGKRMWTAIALITAGSVCLSVDNWKELTFSPGSLFVLLACLCWGLENNCTRMLSLKNPMEIVVIKGFGSGAGALIIGLALGEKMGSPLFLIGAMVLGFVAYGLSIYFYISAQRELGAARTSAYYAAAPFIGVGLSLILFRDPLPHTFWMAAALMLAGTYLTAREDHRHIHVHERLAHEHRHTHHDGHHNHTHPGGDVEHTHYHVHEQMSHAHKHKPDMHHFHEHK